MHDELQKHLAARDALTKEIHRLRQLTGEHEQVVVYVTVSEVSLTKVRKSNIIIDGVDAELLKSSGIGGVIGAGIFDDREKTGKAKPAEKRNETIGFRVIERAELLSDLTTALKKAGALQVLAEPVLATPSGRPASFHAGGEFPIPVPQSNGTTAIEYRKFGTQLDCLPVLLGNSRIRLELRPSVSSIDADRSITLGDVTVPGLRVRELDTAVEMNVGQTLVMAGLLQQVVRKPAVLPSEPANAAAAQSGEVPVPARQADAEPGEISIEELELVFVSKSV